MAVILLDLLFLDGQSVVREPWTARRKRRDDVLAGHDLAGVGLVPYTDDAPGFGIPGSVWAVRASSS
jgi:ATP-dependent DNA ligase